MKRELIAVLVFGVAAFLFNFLNGDSVDASARAESLLVPTLVTETLPDVPTNAYGVFDLKTGQLLFGSNVDEPLPIASITKLFAAASILESEILDHSTSITAKDVAAEGRAGKLVVGQDYTFRELLFPLLLESSNDAAAVYERHISSIEFDGIALQDASGLSKENTASVEELADAVHRLYGSKRYVFDITMLPQYVGPYTGWVNNSPVRHLSGYQGGKHGYTDAAGKTLVSLFEEPVLDGRILGYVILGSNNLEKDVVSLRSFVEQSVQLQ